MLTRTKNLIIRVSDSDIGIRSVHVSGWWSQDGRLFMLQTRNGKRTGLAALKIAVDMQQEVRSDLNVLETSKKIIFKKGRVALLCGECTSGQ